MTDRVPTGSQEGRNSPAAVVLELLELSFMGNDCPREGASSRSATVKLRCGGREAVGQHAERTRILDCVYHAMMNAARKLGVFTNAQEPTMASYRVQSRDRGSDTQGDFSVTLEYHGRQQAIQLRDEDLVTGSRRGFLDALNALLFGQAAADGATATVDPEVSD